MGHDAEVKFKLRRGLLDVAVVLAVTAIAGAIGLRLAGANWWLVAPILAIYEGAYIAASEFWFQRLNYVILRSDALDVSEHSWGFLIGLGLLVPLRVRRTIEYSLIKAIRSNRGSMEIEYKGFDDGKGPILFDKKVRLRIADQGAFLNGLKRHVPALAL